MPEPLDGWHIQETATGVRFKVRLTPRASREGLGGLHGDALKASVTAPAVDNKANQALIRLLAKRLKVAPSRVNLVSGATSRVKLLEAEGLTRLEVWAALAGRGERRGG